MPFKHQSVYLILRDPNDKAQTETTLYCGNLPTLSYFEYDGMKDLMRLSQTNPIINLETLEAIAKIREKYMNAIEHMKTIHEEEFSKKYGILRCDSEFDHFDWVGFILALTRVIRHKWSIMVEKNLSGSLEY